MHCTATHTEYHSNMCIFMSAHEYKINTATL